MENEEKDLNHSHNHQDPFTQFMFGRNHKNKNESETVEEVEVSHDHEETDWFLGSRKRTDNPHKKVAAGGKLNRSQSGSLENILQNVDYTELMGHIDTLITSAGQFKPLLKKARPLIEQLITKKQ